MTEKLETDDAAEGKKQNGDHQFGQKKISVRPVFFRHPDPEEVSQGYQNGSPISGTLPGLPAHRKEQIWRDSHGMSA